MLLSRLLAPSPDVSSRPGLDILPAGLLVVAVLAPGPTHAQAPSEEEPFLGTWLGTAQVGGAEERIPLRIEHRAEDTLTAFGWAHEEFGGDRRLNVSRVTIRGDSLFLEAIVRAHHEAVSAAADGTPAWDRFRSLFLREARMTTTFRPPDAPPQ